MDRIGADFFNVVEAIQKQLGANAIPLTLPIGEGEDFVGIIDLVRNCALTYTSESLGAEVKLGPIPENMVELTKKHRHALIEQVSGCDEELLELFCNEEPISDAQLKAAIRKATHSHTLTPVLCGSAFKNKGVQLLLDAVIDYLPSPIDLPPIIGNCMDGNEIERVPNDDGRLAALVFKVVTDKHVGKLVYVRVYSGTLEAGTYVHNTTKDKKQRIGRLMRMHANRQEMVERLFSGEIGAVIGLSGSTTGDTICCPDNPIILEAIEFPAPVISVAVTTPDRNQGQKLSKGLAKLAEEDPTFVVSSDPETEETIISGMGELHLEIIVDRLRREFGVVADSAPPQVSYRETMTSPATLLHRYAKQSGGHGQFAEIKIILEPLEPGQGFEFKNEIVGGTVPKEYIPAVEKGIIDAMNKGVWADFPVVDVRVRLVDGKSHEVDSSEMAFRSCGRQAFRMAFMKGNPELLEPVMSVTVVTPDDYSGAVTGNLCSKRGRIAGMESRGNVQTISGFVPLANMFGYASDLRTMSQGRASFSMHFEHYEAVPFSVAEEVIEKRRERRANK
jgi:elongation factor G